MSETKPQRTILIVDDEEDVVTYLRTVFSDHGYLPICTTDGAEALELARTKRPDLICLDISMPEPTGVRVYRTLREEQELASIPVVMVTGVQKEFERFISTRKQVPPPDGYISKPFVVEDLLEVVGRLLGG
jgi:CheY-like chemotaxis protein